MRSPPVSSSPCSRAGTRKRPCGERVPPGRSPHPASAPSRPAEPAPRGRGGRDTARVTTPILIDCDPGHDDAIALLLALASPELELLGVTTVSGNQTLEKTTANAIRVLDLAGRADVPVAAGADRPLVRERFA